MFAGSDVVSGLAKIKAMSSQYAKINDLRLRSHIRYAPRRGESTIPRKIGVALALGVVVVAVGFWWAAKV